MQVKWNKKALAQLRFAVRYGIEEFGEETAVAFFYKVTNYEDKLSANPLMGKPEPLLATMDKEY